MTETAQTPTKSLFESLAKLYKQGQLLLLDSDRIMGERGWIPMHNNAVAELSNSLNSPQRWFARWIMRFYYPALMDTNEELINRILFVSIHFTSDVGSSMGTTVDEPLVCAGRLIYEKPMTENDASNSFDYWMCKYWFIGEPHDSLDGWRKTGQSRWHENLTGSESFTVPLYHIISSEKLNDLVIKPLLAIQEEEERVT